MARKIICKNEDDIEIVMSDEFRPWLLQSCEGIYEIDNNIFSSENTMNEGSTYQGSVMKARNIVLILRDLPEANHRENRQMLYDVFKKGSEGSLYYIEDDVTRYIGYYVEQITIDGAKKSRTATISLICPDPFFKDAEEQIVTMAGWEALFEWQHEFLAGGEPLGERSQEFLVSIDNNHAADGIGLTLTLDIDGPVTNPTVYHVENGTRISLGSESNPLQLTSGDRVIITTHTGNKHVYLERLGNRTEINEYLTEDSEFMQLNTGTNTFGYDATSGGAYITVSIAYRFKYVGV